MLEDRRSGSGSFQLEPPLQLLEGERSPVLVTGQHRNTDPHSTRTYLAPVLCFGEQGPSKLLPPNEDGEEYRRGDGNDQQTPFVDKISETRKYCASKCPRQAVNHSDQLPVFNIHPLHSWKEQEKPPSLCTFGKYRKHFSILTKTQTN